MPFLKRSDYEIHYVLDGPEDAPLLVLSNSLGSSLEMWTQQVAEFTPRFRILRYDNRGHGRSSAPPAPYSLADLAGDLIFLLREIGATRVHYCGLSMGGMVGMWLASHHPEWIEKLIISNSAAQMGPKEMWDTRISAVRKDGMRALSKGVMERWFTPSFRERSPEKVAAIEKIFLEVSLEGYAGCAAAIRDMDQREALAQIAHPTLVIAGTHDPSTPAELGRFVANHIPGAHYLELEAAHLSNIEAAARYNAAVMEFLA